MKSRSKSTYGSKFSLLKRARKPGSAAAKKELSRAHRNEPGFFVDPFGELVVRDLSLTSSGPSSYETRYRPAKDETGNFLLVGSRIRRASKKPLVELEPQFVAEELPELLKSIGQMKRAAGEAVVAIDSTLRSVAERRKLRVGQKSS